MKNKFFELNVTDGMTLCYKAGGKTHTLGGPEFELDGSVLKVGSVVYTGEKKIGKHITESYFESAVGPCKITMKIRVCDLTPFIRFYYELSDGDVKMTKTHGKDDLVYARLNGSFTDGTEVRLSEYNRQLYSFCMSEVPAFRDGDEIMGPILVKKDGKNCALLAYEHGSEYPDRFIEFAKEKDCVALRAIKGNYFNGRPIGGKSGGTYKTVWLQFGAVNGTQDDLAKSYRDFQLNGILPDHPSRKPLIYYNTWNDQERTQLKTGTYHKCMTLEHIFADIEIAHRMGIDVYVIDTGWFTKCGDWEVRTDRFPDALDSVSEKLKSYGMKLGLWINPTAVAVSSPILKERKDCIASVNGVLTKPFNVWESEESHGMCLASEYGKVLADTLIRLCKTKNCSYIKWDAIWQYGCTDGNHFHGTDENSYAERGECYSFEMDRSLSEICDAVLEACPDTVLDFDITEEGRNIGLSWLSRGKYFLVNNGPNYHNYDLPDPQWTNMFVNPGPARTWICRPANNYDKWIPSHLFLCHYFPDPPVTSQRMNLGSMILGGNGIWGQLQELSEDDIKLHAEVISAYKKVADDMAAATEKIDGATATTLQKYEKIDPENGRGAIVLFGVFSREGKVTRKIESPCSGKFKIFGNATIEKKDGNFYVTADFDGADAAIVFCL